MPRRAKERSIAGEDSHSVLSQLYRCAADTQNDRAQSLGLRKLNQVVERPDTDSTRRGREGAAPVADSGVNGNQSKHT